MEFKVGDLVRLKSGGPLMTVEQVGESAMTGGEAVWCVWFEMVGKNQVVKRETFSPCVLEISSKPGVGTMRVTRG
ncbi:YodC family protein [Salmonella enterica]|uniref:YodC family protein n=1 Tax=Salmonella enterica TaxID=28901 RepID=UPI00127D5523|nr:DUF2158 domain-containing protein [Salmonella enterica]ECO0583086.1 DUF2158 domain-containing protein [Salmonella enterica subsp. diarizonae]HCM1652535.1 DUF2158 domain-containing protein [Salmonella enterica subsp. diarizonae serovar 48:i:z35]EDB6598462.1 DUF2158 domain-containing protein [Salmonella enterica subsp. diarizonae]EDF7617073.1 DUF2158 domain-containing protein [Salmonella enterica]